MRPDIHCLIWYAQELTRKCVGNCRDPINALDRWLPHQPEVESVGEGLQMPACTDEWLHSRRWLASSPELHMAKQWDMGLRAWFFLAGG